MFNPKKFADWPSPKKTKWLLIIGLVIVAIIYPIMTWFLIQSGDTTSIFASQLSFSGPFLKAQYTIIIGAGGLSSYTLGQCLDYGFMISYALMILSLNIIIARKHEAQSKWRNIGFLVALVGPIAACLDACENAFILLTLSDPLGFPDWWAVAHSSFALVKWILLLFAIGWALIAAVHYILVRKKQ